MKIQTKLSFSPEIRLDLKKSALIMSVSEEINQKNMLKTLHLKPVKSI
ncbi:hypothetical protein [Lactiplantibacillus plantarum]|nr:hypothetical protein [Lactiplantibacillus plantarum]MDG6770155.1 hypothetical protein [Lactiplantibacillus plantarum]